MNAIWNILTGTLKAILLTGATVCLCILAIGIFFGMIVG